MNRPYQLVVIAMTALLISESSAAMAAGKPAVPRATAQRPVGMFIPPLRTGPRITLNMLRTKALQHNHETFTRSGPAAKGTSSSRRSSPIGARQAATAVGRRAASSVKPVSRPVVFLGSHPTQVPGPHGLRAATAITLLTAAPLEGEPAFTRIAEYTYDNRNGSLISSTLKVADDVTAAKYGFPTKAAAMKAWAP